MEDVCDRLSLSSAKHLPLLRVDQELYLNVLL
jgi:hypothetical protein